jgi:hypothetical protein
LKILRLISLFEKQYGKTHPPLSGRFPDDVCCGGEPDSKHAFVSCRRRLDEHNPELDEVSESDETDEDMPDLVPVSGDTANFDDNDDNPRPEFENELQENIVSDDSESSTDNVPDNAPMMTLAERLNEVLHRCQPFPGDGPPADPRYRKEDN